MAHFYGNLKGSRGEATRCGTRQSGIRVSARSWAGSVTVRFEDLGGDVRVYIETAPDSSVGGRIVYAGPLAALVNASRLVPKA